MTNVEVIEILNKMIEYIDESPSLFVQEYNVDLQIMDDDLPINEFYDIIIEILKRETKGFDFSAENVDELLKLENDNQCKAFLVAATKDLEYIKKQVRTNPDFGILYKRDLALFTQDKQFIEECINLPEMQTENNRINKITLIQAMDSDYIKRFLTNPQNTNLPLKEKTDLYIATHDSEFIKQFIEETPSLKINQKMNLLLATNDIEYIDSCLRSKEFGMNDFQKVTAIKRIASLSSNTNAIKMYLNEFESELGSEAKTVLYLLTNDENLIKSNLTLELISKSKTQSITLPEQMTIGIEIESIGNYGSCLQGVELNGWLAKEDASLREWKDMNISGVEMVSPVLSTNEHIEDEINMMCNLLKACGQSINDSCGGHVHIGANYLSTTDSLVNFLYLIENSEDLLYILSNEEGCIPREGTMTYAKPFTSKLNKVMEEGSVDLSSELELDDFIHELKKVQPKQRYIGVNFFNLGTNRNTIEFRMANGTLNPEQWVENINLFGGLIKAAEEIMKIQSKSESDRTTEEIKKIELFRALPSLDDNARLSAILDLSIEGDKSTYLRRFKVNRELIQEKEKDIFSNHNQKFDEQFVLKKGMIRPKNIGRAVFTGEDAVRGEEIQVLENELNREISHSLQRDVQFIEN